MLPVLHDTFAQIVVFSSEQLLREIIAALIGIATRPSEVMIDARASGAAEVMREREDFRGWPTRVNPGLSERAGSAHCEKFRCNAHESREQQLFAIQFRPKTHHGVE